MVAVLLALLLIALLFGLGFAAHLLWIIAIVLLVVWALGFLFRGAETGLAGGVRRRRRWYYW